jgi:hypothetical protein
MAWPDYAHPGGRGSTKNYNVATLHPEVIALLEQAAEEHTTEADSKETKGA